MREPTAPAYYDRRAPEYDDWYLGRGGFAERERPGFAEELDVVVATLAGLRPARTLDVACGTGFLTRHLRGAVTALDRSPRMLAIARERLPAATLVEGDALTLPFGPDSFERLVTCHFYGHLVTAQRERFLARARRIAPDLVVVDASSGHSEADEERSTRVLRDGSSWEVYKRYFAPEALLEELGGGEVLFAGTWFLAVRSPR